MIAFKTVKDSIIEQIYYIFIFSSFLRQRHFVGTFYGRTVQTIRVTIMFTDAGISSADFTLVSPAYLIMAQTTLKYRRIVF